MSLTLVQSFSCAVLTLLLCGADCRRINENGTIETFACTTGQFSVITPTCAHYSEKHVINLSAIRFGYLEHNESCTNETRGCEEDISKSQFQDALLKMSGRQQSDPYQFPSNPTSVNCPESNYSTSRDYMIAYYDCVDSSDIESMCSNLNRESSEIYLWNDGYPDEGASLDNELCECALNVTSDVIQIHTYYDELNPSQNMTLKYTSNNATDYVVWDGNKNAYGHRVVTINVTEYNMTLTWVNDVDGYSNRTGKYWIKVKAMNGSIHIKCPANDVHTETTVTQRNATAILAATTNPMLDTDNATISETHLLINSHTKIAEHILNTTESNTNGVSGESKGGQLDTNVVIAACAGTAGVLIIIIVIVTVVKRRKHAKEDKLIKQRLSQLRPRQRDSGASGRHDHKINNPRKHNSKSVEDKMEMAKTKKKHHVKTHEHKEDAAPRATSSVKKDTRKRGGGGV